MGGGGGHFGEEGGEGKLSCWGSTHSVFKYKILSKSEQWLLRKSILSFGTLSFIILLLLVLLRRNTVVALASAGISVVLASWGLARLTDNTVMKLKSMLSFQFWLPTESRRMPVLYFFLNICHRALPLNP